MAVLVHRAVEPDNLSVKGKKRLEAMLRDGEYIVQPKLDGVYCQVVAVSDNHLQTHSWEAFSRTGEPLRSVRPEILAQFSGADPGCRFIGELWLPDTPHSTINGMARKHSEQPLELHLFDVAGGDAEGLTYHARHDLLGMQEWKRGIEVVKNLNVPAYGYDPASMMDYLYGLAAAIKGKTSAYDGLVLKDAAGLFTPGHGKDGGAIKIKPRLSGDFRVKATTTGIGNREGGIGALVLDLGGGVDCEVGSGLNMADIFDRDFIGKIVEVEYLAVTKDGRLREPVYKSVRFDKAEADVLACNVP